MSVTFSSDCAASKGFAQEHCLCAQMAEGFMRDATPEALRAAADPACFACGGSGVETVEVSDRPELNLANGNARLLLCALRISDADLFGSVALPEARRAIIRARASSLEPFTRQALIEYGAARADGNLVALRPLRVHAAGVDEEGIAAYIDRFERLVSESAARGATNIHWG